MSHPLLLHMYNPQTTSPGIVPTMHATSKSSSLLPVSLTDSCILHCLVTQHTLTTPLAGDMFLQHDCHTHPSNSELAYPNPASKSILHYGFITPLHHCKAFTHMAVLRPLVVWQEGCISPEMAPLSFIASILELGHVCHASFTLSSHLPPTHWNPSLKTRSSLKN
jgi:hypothetical protein